MAEPVLDDATRDLLRRRFSRSLVAAWPEGGLVEDDVFDAARVERDSIEDAPALAISFGGSTTSYEWHGSIEDAESIVDDVVETMAWDLEGDRWIAGDGWREYRA